MLVGQRFGPFEIEKELGSGAMGTVFKAVWHREEKTETVALKIVSLALIGNESAIARFEREANILQQLRHPHIVRYRASGTHKSSRTKFIAMEFVDGQPLDKILQKRGRVDWQDVVVWGKQLCGALQHAHDKGIIHRDLKPSNLMITTENVLKLTDFGIAKDTDVTALTGANSTIGTAAYMSPEQCKGARDLTAKSDLYSLGIVFYELLTGRKPFFAETTVDMFLKHVNEIPVRPRRLNAEIPIWLDNLIMFLLEKDKDHRPLDAPTVGKLLEDVEEKVKSQASVGAEVANARKMDRPVVDGPLDETERELAKSLRAGKKRKKKKGEAWYRKPWVGIGGAAVLLLAMLGSLVYAMMPPGIDGSYAQVQAAPEEAKLEASAAFLARFADTQDPRVEEVREAFKAVKTRQTESVLNKRFNSKFRANAEGFDPDAYAAAVLALEAEEMGELTRAADQWEAVRRKQADIEPAQYAESDPATRASLRWMADRRIQAIQVEMPALLKKLKDGLTDQRSYDLDIKPPAADDSLGLADKAFRFEDLGDLPKARSAWLQLASELANDMDRRPLYMLASQQAMKAAPKPGDREFGPADREKLLAEKLMKLEAAAGPAAANPEDRVARRDIRNECRDIMYLYQNDPSPTIQGLIARAEKLKDSLPK